MEHQSNGFGVKLFCTILVVLVFGGSFFVFVLLQIQFVKNSIGFWTLIAGLLAASFWSTAMEAAFSTLSDPHNQFAKEAEEKNIEHLKSYQTFKSLDGSDIDERHVKQLKAFEQKKRKLRGMHRLATGIDRTEIVGAFAALSVFLNLSVGILLPLFMFESLAQPFALNLPINLIDQMPAFLSYSVEFPQSISLENRTLFVFAASTLPVLLFGKIIPKAVGLNYSVGWIKLFQKPAMLIKNALGWISIGSTWYISNKGNSN